jgi:Zn-dependent protease
MSFDRGSRGRLVIGVPREAFRPSAIFVGIVALFITSGWMAWNEFGNVRLDVFMFVITGWLVSLCLHEYAHALTAYRFGDIGVAERGYLSLNPLKYSNPLLSIVLPVFIVVLGGIGLPGGAVWVDRHAMSGRLRHTLVSVVGPATNVLFLLALAIPFWIGVQADAHPEFWAGVALLAFLQLMASLLNLLPVPGLDGGNTVQPWLSPQWQRGYAHVAPFGFLLLFALIWNEQTGRWFFDAVFAIGDALGIPADLYSYGFSLIHFWS